VNLRVYLVAFAVLVDLVIMLLVIRFVLIKKGVLQLFSAGLEKLRPLATESRELCSNYLRANYSGNPDDLPRVLEQLLAQLDEKARANGLTLERPVLKLVLAQSVRPEDGVPASVLQAALRKVA
jgi:Tfp pilus assembly protein PilO